MSKKSIAKGKKIVDSIVHKTTLKIFRVGCDELNFKLLEFCSHFHTSKDIKNEFKISPMAVSRRTMALKEAGLLDKINKKAYIQSSLGRDFFNLMSEMKKNVTKEMSKLI